MRARALSVDFSHFSGENALFTLVSAVIVAVLTIAHNRRLTREELETSRKEWSDVATRRLELNRSLEDQIQTLNRRMTDLTMEHGELRKENEFLRDKNVELQSTLDISKREIHQLQMDLRRVGIEVHRVERGEGA